MSEKTLFEEMRRAHEAAWKLFYAMFPWHARFMIWLSHQIARIALKKKEYCMSDYRFQIVDRHDLPCLHVMIDHARPGEEIIQTYIPLGDILAAIKRYKAPKDTPVRRSEGATLGWEIRRTKQGYRQEYY